MIIKKEKQLFIELNPYQSRARDEFLEDPDITLETIDNCVLCGETKSQQIAAFDRYRIPVTTVSCINCGLIYSKEQLCDRSTRLFYDKYYRKIYEGIPRATLSHQYYRKLYGGWVPKVPAFIKSTDFILEFGCGGGWNLLPFKMKGLSHRGFDYDSDMIRFGVENYDLCLYEGGLDEALAQGVKANYVIISQVLEHLRDPVGFLKRLSGCLQEGALVCITVPSIDYLLYFGGNSTHFSLDINLQNAHNFFFSESTLETLILKAGYRPLVILGGYALVRQGDSSVTLIKKSSHKSISKMYAAQSWKSFVNRVVPTWFINIILARLYYALRPAKTAKWILINKFGLGLR